MPEWLLVPYLLHYGAAGGLLLNWVAHHRRDDWDRADWVLAGVWAGTAIIFAAGVILSA